MRSLLACSILLSLGEPAHAEEAESSSQQEEIGSDGAVFYTLSEWIEENGGIAAVELMLAEEAKSKAKQDLEDNPAEAQALKDAARNGLEHCKGTSIGRLSAPAAGPDLSDADFYVGVSIPLDAFYGLDWNNSEISVGSGGYGINTNASLLFSDPSAVGDCVQAEIDQAVEKILEERDKLLSGDYSTVKKALAADAVGYIIDEAYDYSPELGEFLDTIERVCTLPGGSCL